MPQNILETAVPSTQTQATRESDLLTAETFIPDIAEPETAKEMTSEVELLVNPQSGVQMEAIIQPKDAETRIAEVQTNMETRYPRRDTVQNIFNETPETIAERRKNKKPPELIAFLSFGKGLSQFGERAKTAAMSELSTLIKMHAWKYVTHTQSKPMRSQMVITPKFTPDGSLIKIKARLVANGKTQTLLPFQNSSSPTVSIMSLFIFLKIAAVEQRELEFWDVPCAYLQADMDHHTFMILDKRTTYLLLSIDNKCRPFVRPDGSLQVQLLRALYGCKQSGKLWKDRLSFFLKSLGMIENGKDPCVYNMQRNGCQLTVIHHVDDLGCSSSDVANTQWIKQMLDLEFGQLTAQPGSSKNYLGMKILRNPDGTLEISMNKLLNKIIDSTEGCATTPANPKFFNTEGDKSKLSKQSKASFSSAIAQMLYLARYIRLDILLAVCYLTKETTRATQSSLLKLQRVMKYLKSTQDLHRHISTEPFDRIVAYVDASFAGNDDFRSQSGLVIELGNTVVFAQSKTQKMIARNSSAAELIALSDKLQTIKNANEFMIAQGYAFKEAQVFEDNESVIKMTNGKAPKQQNKYLGVRQAEILAALKEKEISLQHFSTAKMKADALTKPLQGEAFRASRNWLLGVAQLSKGGTKSRARTSTCTRR